MRARTAVVAAAITVALAGGWALAQDHAYVGANKCKMCHKVQNNSWLETTHAKALEVAQASTDPKFDSSCLSCHATGGDEALGGVQCEACHGPGSDYQKMSIMKDREAAIANGLVIPSQATCDGCHKDDGHSMAVSLADNLNNPKAVHEFKNPPSE